MRKILIICCMFIITFVNAKKHQMCSNPKENEIAFSIKDPFLGDWKGTMNGGNSYGVLTAYDEQEYVLRIYNKETLSSTEYANPILDLFGTRTENQITIHSHFLEKKIVEFPDGKKKPDMFFKKIKEIDSLIITPDGISGKITPRDGGDIITLELKKIENLRKSPTLGMKPPENAIVLFDGTSLDKWNMTLNSIKKKKQCGKPWALIDNTIQIVTRQNYNLSSKQLFGDCQLHIEFMNPYLPNHNLNLHGRCNSGVYLQARFEIQVYDSYGKLNCNIGCGKIYGKTSIDYFVCRPPMEWQTYDVDFTAPRFDENGKKIKNGRMTVKFNGILVHKDVELDHRKPDKKCGGDDTYANDSPKGPLYLQDHGYPTRYRNIWILEK